MVPPASIGLGLGSAGITRSTYRSPNSVFGSSRAVVFDGIRSALSGSIAMTEVTLPFEVDASRTSPTISPRTLTSALRGRALPTVSVTRSTLTTCLNVLL